MADGGPDVPGRDSLDALVHDWSPAGESNSPTRSAPVWEPAAPPLAGWRLQPSGPSTVAPGDDPRLSFDLDLAIQTGSGPVSEPTLQRATSGRSGPRKARRFPRPGEILARFRILAELGRGAFACVYLAEQCDLGDRCVVLKVSAAVGDEPLNLARLQHTHIVPIFSVHDDPATGWRLICMPYVGGADLAQVLRGARLPSMATGRSLIDALDRVGHAPSRPGSASADPVPGRAGGGRLSGEFAPPSEVSTSGESPAATARPSRVRSLWGRYAARLLWWADLPGAAVSDCDPEAEREPARRYLRSATYVQAAVWIVARLAEALQHAHERGIVHRDLKPSNVLIAADGTPMLLDFNLSAEIALAPTNDGAVRAALGGTLPYMAPEHLDAFSPLGSTPPSAVGPAADIYSLGLILFEMVAGQQAFADPPAAPRLSETIRMMLVERLRGAPSARATNPLVPWGLDAILARCLDPDPARRYARAGDLAEDLRRLLNDRPLKHVPEPSLRETLTKWARRHPRAVSSTSVGAVALVLLLVLGAVAWGLAGHLAAAEARQQLLAFDEAFGECQLLLNTTSGPFEHLTAGVARADAALAVYGIRGPGSWTPGRSLEPLPDIDAARLRERLSELIALRARAQVVRAEPKDSEPERRQRLREAVAWLNLAQRIDPRPSHALFHDRADYHAALGDAELARADRAAAPPPSSARDHTLIGTALLARGELDRAEAALIHAVELEPDRFWSWFALALCHYQQGRHADAAAEFGLCAVLRPDFAWPQANRGLALAASGRLVEARVAYTRALEANPEFLTARINRSLVSLELDDPKAALADLDYVLTQLGRSPATLSSTRTGAQALAAHAEALSRLGRRKEAEREFASALRRRPDDAVIHVARGFFRIGADPAGARADFEHVLSLDPHHARAHLGLAHLLRGSDPRAALPHADAALAAEPGLSDALQLRALIRASLGDLTAEADVDQLERIPTPHRLYNAACALARLHAIHGSERLAERALSLLRRALDVGFDPLTAVADPDFSPLRARPEFQALFDRSPPPLRRPTHLM